MPHLILEYAQAALADDEVLALLDAVHEAAVASGLFQESHIKTRAYPVRFYRTGSNQAPFIHAQLRIKQGRSEAHKKALSRLVLAAIRGLALGVDIITVEVADMDAVTYAKYTRAKYSSPD